MKTLEKFLNWLKELKERLTDKKTNVKAIVYAVFSAIIYIFGINPETNQLAVEFIDVLFDNIGQIAASLGLITTAFMTLYNAFSKSKKRQ